MIWFPSYHYFSEAWSKSTEFYHSCFSEHEMGSTLDFARSVSPSNIALTGKQGTNFRHPCYIQIIVSIHGWFIREHPVEINNLKGTPYIETYRNPWNTPSSWIYTILVVSAGCVGDSKFPQWDSDEKTSACIVLQSATIVVISQKVFSARKTGVNNIRQHMERHYHQKQII